MSLSCLIANVSVSIQSISRPDLIDQKTQCTVVVIDLAGTAFYQRGMPISVTDSILGSVFTGYLHSPVMSLLYPNPGRLWTIDCIQRGDYLAGKRTSNKIYNNQYGGTVAVDQIQRYGSAEGLSAKAALRWDELETDWAAGTLTNTVATTNAGDGNPGDGDLELALAGATVNFSQVTQSDFNAGTTGGGLSSPSTGGVQFTSCAAIKFQATESLPGTTNAATYVKIWSGSYVIASGDALLYDMWIADSCPDKKLSLELVFSDGTSLVSNINDNDGLGYAANPSTDLSGVAVNTWYSRTFILGFGGNTGKTLSYAAIVCAGQSQGTYTAYFRKISIGNSGSTVQGIFASTSTVLPIVPQQLQNNGYSAMSCTFITAYERTGYMYSPFFSMSGAGIARSSYVSWNVTMPTVNTNNFTFTITASIDGFATFLPCTQNGAIPGLLPGTGLGSKSVIFVYTMTNNGNDPTLTPFLSRISGNVQPSYNATKSDVIYTTNGTGWSAGTLTNLNLSGYNNLQLNGYARNWDDAYFGSQTLYGSSSPAQSTNLQKFFLTTGTGADARSRLDFAGNAWQNFTMECDINLPSASVDCSLVWRCTGWQNNNDTYAYMCAVRTNLIQFGHGTNSASGAGSFTGIGNVVIALSANQTYRLKVVVNGTSHKIYLNDVLYINATDSTYSAAGYVGLRYYNNSGSTSTGTFDNFGIVASLSGTWVSPAIDIHALGTILNSELLYQIDSGDNLTTTSFLAEISLNNGSTWTTCTNLQASGFFQCNPVPGLTSGTNVSSMTQVLIRLTITSSTAATGLQMPDLTSVTLRVLGSYSASGTRVSPSLSLSAVTRAATSLVNWNAVLPTNTSLAVATSINGGSTYQSVASAGSAITGIALQPSPIDDVFASNSSANYTQSNWGGTTGTWVWDTANSRLTGSGGNYGTLVYSTVLTAADNQAMADFDQCDGSGILTNYTSTSSGYYIQIWDASASGTTNSVKLFKRSSSTNTQIGSTATITFVRGTPHRFVLDIEAGVITVSMDGNSIITYTDGSPLGAGYSGLLLNTLARAYSLRIQQYGQNVSALSLLTKVTLTSTDPTVTPQLLDMQAFVSSPDIGAGSLIPQVVYQKTYISDNITDLNTKSNYWTTFRNDGTLIFQARNATPAPFVLSSLNSQIIAGQTINDILLDAVELDNSGDSYRNHQIMSGAIATATFTEIKFGDGSTQTWNVVNPLTQPPTSIILNGQIQTFGVKGIDTGKNFYYQVGSTAIDQDAGGTILQEADSFTVIYTGSFSQDVILDNTALSGTITQSQMAAIENSAGGSSSGIVEAVLDVSGTPTTVASATAQGNQLLQRDGNIGRTFICKTLRSGLTPGMQIAQIVPEVGLNNVQMLITGIDVSIAQAPGVTGGLLYTWKLTMMEGPNLGTWVRLFTNALS
jgi:hypothetical protein